MQSHLHSVNGEVDGGLNQEPIQYKQRDSESD